MGFDQHVLSDYHDNLPFGLRRGLRSLCFLAVKNERGVGGLRTKPDGFFVCGKYHFIREGCVEQQVY